MSEPVPPAPVEPAAGEPRRRSRVRAVWWWTSRALLLVAAIVAALIILFFSVDLGPAVRERAEREATNYLERPMHIGALKALVWPGRYELDDVVIEGVSKTDRPFLTAKRIIVTVTWRTLIRHELFVDVDMSDWNMLIENWAGNRPSSLPKLTPRNRSTGPSRFTTTVHVTANRGQFAYEDHGAPWSVVCPNLNFSLARSEVLKTYVGKAGFTGGVVQIQNYLPMSAGMSTSFTLDGGLVQLQRIDLVTDGATTRATGHVDFSHWPEQTYQVDSRLSFSRMRELFFAAESWRVKGDGRFTGSFHLPQHGGRDLHGQFTSDLMTMDTPSHRLEFPHLHGSLAWLPDRFVVTDAGADFSDGAAHFSYGLMPLGTPGPPGASFDVAYQDVDLQTFTRAIQWQGPDVRGRASGRHELRWQSGRFGDTIASTGRVTVAPPPGTLVASETISSSEPVVSEGAPFQKDRPLGPLPIAGEIAYRQDPDGLDVSPSWVASPSTFIAFHGRADFSTRSNLAFHVTSHDWQQSDRILAAILTAASGPTGAVAVGGFGEFDGVMTGAFSQPRIAGLFTGESLRSWGVSWGRVNGNIIIENQFVTIAGATITGASPQQRIDADGRFSLGFRKPAESAEELKDVHVRVAGWPVKDFRQAFDLLDWPVDATIDEADIHLSGPYHGPMGSGTLRFGAGTAWGEAFDSVTGDLAFNGVGLDISHIVMAKDVGRITGSALLKWDGTYAFDAQGDKVPIESLTSFAVAKAPLSGVLHFTASGEGALAAPRYSVRFTVPDLSAGSQGVGAVSGALEVRNKTLFIQQLNANSVLLNVTGSGSIALNEAYDATLNFRFTDSRLDPYLPLIAPKLASQLSQYTRAVISGTIQVQGELKNRTALGVYGTVETADLTLFDYQLKNDGPVHLNFENNLVTIRNLRLVGQQTNLAIEGEVPLTGGPMHLTADGAADLGVLKLLSSEMESSGAATIHATVGGTMDGVQLSGQAEITDGRLRYRSFPHGLEQINGPIIFDADRITIGNVRGRMAEGNVTVSGSIELKGLIPDQYDVQAEGRSMGLRFPTGFRSTVNAKLTLTGPVAAPTLAGDVTVLRSTFLQEIANEQAILALTALGSPAASGDATVFGAPVQSAVPLKLDIRISAPTSSVRIETTVAQIFGAANLAVRGTIDAPSVTGYVNIERGNMSFNGNRYAFQPSSIYFSNPSKIQPFFDVSFTTRVRVPTQTYDVTFRITGEPDKLGFEVNSDPPLPESDIINLILGQRYDVRTLEVTSAQSPQLAQQQAMSTLAAQFLTMPISSRIGSVVERTIPFDTFSLVPVLGNEAALQALSPGARVTLGKRVSERVFLTYSRALNTTGQYDIILLEYEESDRISWVLSRNEDRTFALDFRIRHVF